MPEHGEPLTDREQEILRVRYGLDGGEPCTLADAGKMMGGSRERIRQIEAKALAKLRHPASPGALRNMLSL